MTTTPTAGDVTRAVLLAEVAITDQMLTIHRNARTAAIRQRVEACTPGPWTMLDRRHHRSNAQVEIHIPQAGSYTHLANVMRRGSRPLADADLISHTPTDTGWLLDEVDRLRAERDLLLAAAAPDTRLAYYGHRAEARHRELRQSRRTAHTWRPQ